MDEIKLTIPSDGKYLSSVRLLASGILSHLDVDIDWIEDIKLCITEACNLAITTKKNKDINIKFYISDNFKIEIANVSEKSIEEDEKISLSLTIMECLMDEVYIRDDKMYIIKKIKG